MKKIFSIPLGLVMLAATTLTVSAAYNVVWDQGFETDTAGWLDNDDFAGYGYINQVPSGDMGITSAEGSYHALVEGLSADCPSYNSNPECFYGPFSRFDGYRDTWTQTWTAEIDVYLDPAWAAGEGFDYSVAANGSDGNHQRDYIFHVTKDTSMDALLVSGSNNTNFSPREDLENQNYYQVDTAGWYTLQHVFYDNAGALAVDLNLLDSGGNLLFTETRYNAADTIPTEVGGNRYAWFTHVTIADGLAVDNHQLMFFEPEDELLHAINGGGQLHEELGNKPKDWHKVSFGLQVEEYTLSGIQGEVQINLHNVGNDDLDKTKFHSTEITNLTYYESDSNTCESALNFTAIGDWEGEPGYTMIFRAGDSGSPNDLDTARIELRDPNGVLVYDTHTSGEFSDESSCVGTARTGLDAGNLTITH